ncbi:hypothetical protein INT47_003705 [Mucor saturninus]|uniref:Uncharacterized protein n=1 Tax=Mucor saturninus TaxID=64648 RepID=A0A8H7R9S1_9FUNG|nr:hypothetical protein INT47_003705 [Mucor saturninus]
MPKRQRVMDQDWGLSSSSSSCSSSDSSDDEGEFKPCGLFKLPFEIVSHIFILSSNPNLPVVNQFLYRQLYYCSDSIKIRFLEHKYTPENVFEEAVKYPFFSLELLKRLDKLHNEKLSFKGKKIPARLFLEEPSESLRERDAIVLELLERGACANRPKGFPLIKSAQLGRLDRVKLLIQFGADPTIRNNMALRVCAARNNKEMVLYFLDDLKVKPDSDTLKACVQKNLWEMFQILVDHGGVPDMSTINST